MLKITPQEERVYTYKNLFYKKEDLKLAKCENKNSVPIYLISKKNGGFMQHNMGDTLLRDIK